MTFDYHDLLYCVTLKESVAANLGAERILQTLTGIGATARLKRFDRTPESVETAFLASSAMPARPLSRWTEKTMW